ncbi:MAG TPA: hypothetical protein VF524_03790 [Polyangia bacterium]
MGLEQEELSGSVIGAAMEVTRHLGLDSWSRSTRTPSLHFAVVRSYRRAVSTG